MHIHFIGICGTAMGNVALMMRAAGHTVTGSDENIYPPMSDLLIDAGVEIIPGFRPENLQPVPDLVIVANKLSRGNVELEAALDSRLRYTSLPELLKEEVIRGRTSIVLTGTHGKTTTSAMTSWVLQSAGLEPNFMVGGAPGNFDAGWQYRAESQYIVLEGDEYDTAYFDKRSKFFHYLPTILLINNIEFDHADIFGSLEEILLAFRRLVNIVPHNGLIVANGDDENVRDVIHNSFTPVVTVGLSEQCELRATNVRYDEEGTSIDVVRNDELEGTLWFPLLGEFNVRNVLGVTAIARHVGIEYDVIASAFRTFRNTRRRLEKVGEWNNVLLYDDFAHHPTAIAGTLRAIRTRYPERRIRAIFEPRSNTTRRNVFQTELAECFRDADDVTLAQIDRLDELPPSERLDTARLVADIEASGAEARFLPDVPAIVEHIISTSTPGDVIVVMSNGGFGGMVRKLEKGLG
ncbi:MAG: UDP-N-acetylmuramate:L-alanyl-gamma-D-glutamyl-meso-diaminopimelate ligase [Candidatus Kapaibacterium sp.]